MCCYADYCPVHLHFLFSSLLDFTGLESYIYFKCIYAILLWCLHIHGSESIAGAPMMDYDEKVEGHCPLYFLLQSRT